MNRDAHEPDPAARDAAAIEPAEVRRIAALAHLAFDAPGLARMADELGTILSYMRGLDEVDVDGVEPLEHPGLGHMPLRPDAAQPSLSLDEALAGAARRADEGFVVPAFVDEG